MHKYPLTLLLFPVLILISSCGGATEDRSGDEDQNEITAAFPRLVATHPVADSGASYQLVQQEYRLQNEKQLYTGTLTNNQWKGSLKVKGTFQNGKVQNIRSWFQDGSKNSETTVQPDSSSNGFVTTTWYPSGELKAKYNDRTGKKYYKSGALQTEWDERSVTDYWKNGQRQTYRSLKNSSQVSSLDGVFKKWHTNGELSLDGQFTNGQKDGRWIYYDSSGTVKKVLIFDNGKRDSTITNP